MKITKQDEELIEIATTTLKNNLDLYGDISCVVASAVRAKSGKIYTGINILTSHAICAEQVAIGNAFANQERELDTIVAVKAEKDKSIRIVSPCGLCRYTFDKLKQLKLNAIVMDGKKTLKVNIKDLLPYPYTRFE